MHAAISLVRRAASAWRAAVMPGMADGIAFILSILLYDLYYLYPQNHDIST